jgi:hypothetical protein
MAQTRNISYQVWLLLWVKVLWVELISIINDCLYLDLSMLNLSGLLINKYHNNYLIIITIYGRVDEDERKINSYLIKRRIM